MERPRPALIDGIAQDRLEVMLGHVDDEGIARIFAEQRRLHRRPRGIGRALDIADLVDAQRLGKDLVGNAIAPKGLERSRQDGSGLGVARKLRVVLEQQERQAVEVEPERRGETDRAGADDDDGLDAAAHRSGVLRRIGEVPADDRSGHRRLLGQQEEQRADGILRLADTDRGAPARIVRPGIGFAILRPYRSRRGRSG